MLVYEIWVAEKMPRFYTLNLCPVLCRVVFGENEEDPEKASVIFAGQRLTGDSGED